MPPKAAPGKKTTDKVKAKVIEDKTFGLKNKKGSKQQKFIQQVAKQVTNKPVLSRAAAELDPNLAREKKKEEEKKKKEELSQLFKPVAQTIPKGVDPKSVVCIYYKQGLCQKGDRCKFSHDLAVERKAEKRNIYEDTREADGMENWDDAKLEDVVNQKHGEDNNKKISTTQIVCKFFIEAVENKTYGWFWSCPNGDKCMYKHALPPGFTLKSEAKKTDKDDEISLEMLVEKERASLGTKVTKVTLESFLAWKKRKLTEKKEEISRKEDKKRTDFKLGFHNGLTGRDLFTFNPDMIANDDEDAENDIDYRHRADDDDELAQPVRRLDADTFAREAKEVDDTGTIATDDRFAYLDSMLKQHDADLLQRKKDKEALKEAEAACAGAQVGDVEEEGEEDDEENDQEDGEENAEEQDEDLTEEEHKNSLRKILNDKTNSNPKDKKLQTNNNSNKIEIDESLFNLEDLEDIEDELEQLDI